MLKKIKERKMISTAAGAALAFAGGFIFSGGTIAGAASFADISLVGAVNLPYAASAFLGAILRCMFTDNVGRCIVKLGAMATIVIAKMFSHIFSRPTSAGILTATSVLLTGSAISVLIGEFPQKLLFYAIYGAIAGFVSYAACVLWREYEKSKVIDLGGQNGCFLGVVYIILSAVLCSVDTIAVNAGLVVISAVAVFSAYFYSGFSGAVCGALGVCGAFLASSETGTAASILPAAALIAGFAGRERILLSAVFFSVSGFMLVVFTGGAITAEMTFSIVCGVALFLAAAPHYQEKWLSVRGESAELKPDISTVRTNFLSDVIDAVRCDSSKISAALISAQRKMYKESTPKNNVCGMCYRRGICREEMGEISGEIIPILPEECINKKEAVEEYERLFRLSTAQRLMDLRYSDERRLIMEQFGIIADIVRVSGEKDNIRYSQSLSMNIEEALGNHNINILRCWAGYTPSNRLTAEIFFSAGEIPESSERICGILSDTLGVRLEPSASVSSEKELKIGIYEPPIYDAEIHSAAVCAAGSKLSGDSSASFFDSTGKRYIVLSDGMGSGKNAAVDSHMVIGLFRRLVCSGMKPELAVKLVNSIMVTKSREESFATLDGVILDLDTCIATSVKSGAAPTIIRKGNDVIKLSSPVFPIGIVEEAELSISEQKLSEGDIIIMFSDGITENAYLFIKELLLSGNDIREIVREITVKAGVFNPSARSDDVTVIGIKIVKK